MSEAGSASRQQPSGLEPVWLGIGSPRPQSRVKQNSMFGHVVDAFDEKSIVKIGEVTPYEKRKKAAEEAAAAAAQKAKEEEEQERKKLEQAQEDENSGRHAADEVHNNTVGDVTTNNAMPPFESVLDVVSSITSCGSIMRLEYWQEF